MRPDKSLLQSKKLRFRKDNKGGGLLPNTSSVNVFSKFKILGLTKQFMRNILD